MKYTIILLFFTCLINAQNNDLIDAYNGIWIAKPYYESFEKTGSAIASKKAFSFSDAVGLRINSTEIKDSIITIGFSRLHDHMLHPETSRYLVSGKDTIYEQGSLYINLLEQNEDSFLLHSYFNNKYFTSKKITFKNGQLFITDNKKKRIAYVRITKDFPYSYPNPLYYYTRKRVLAGTYILKDSTRKVVSKNLTINGKSIITEYKPLKGYTAFYSTDIYCGPPRLDDLVILCKDTVRFKDCKVFVIKKKKNKIKLYRRSARHIYSENKKLGKPYYVLTKIKG